MYFLKIVNFSQDPEKEEPAASKRGACHSSSSFTCQNNIEIKSSSSKDQFLCEAR